LKAAKRKIQELKSSLKDAKSSLRDATSQKLWEQNSSVAIEDVGIGSPWTTSMWMIVEPKRASAVKALPIKPVLQKRIVI
jgi:hypothetical protein